MSQLTSLSLLLAVPVLLFGTEPAPDRVEFFEKKVRPVLVNRCYGCHSAETKPAGGLRVDDRHGLLRGGASGPAVVPGNPADSILIQRIRHTDPQRRMPKEGGPVTDAELADLTAWIQAGVAWPKEVIPSSIGRPRPSYEKLKATHWAWQPLTDPVPPPVRNTAWPSSNLDRFIAAKLEQSNLAPVGDASRLTLIRRVTFDLTGLPPTPPEIGQFLNDRRPEAYARLVDRLLQSPRFGERWGRHWLDIARYAESTGPSRNIPYPYAWRYRDYVLDAVNRDVPYDRFVQEQVAGDLLPASSPTERDRLLTATGFLALGGKDVNQRFKERFQMDNVDEQIDTVSRSVLGLTVSCARCHDHKFDPIPVTDYYALAGIFTSTDIGAGLRSRMGGSGLDYYDSKNLVRLSVKAPQPDPETLREAQARVAAAKKEWDAIRGTKEGLSIGPNGRPKQQPFRFAFERAQSDLWELTTEAEQGYAIHAVRDAAKPADTEVRLRGEAERLGPVVARGFLTTFAVPGAAPVDPGQSGRLQFAQWLTSPRNPLTPRVVVNRVWHHLFGQGIVTSVDNFGINGAPPSHPELLDHLASGFIRDGWSIKKLVRSIVLSRTYRLGSEATAAHREADPANRLLWRHSPRRLEAEEIRDAILAASGQLDVNPPGRSAAAKLRMVEMRDDGPEALGLHEQADHARHRSVYLPLLRGVVPKALQPFDPVAQSLVTGQRDATTVPAQALFLLNSSFVRRQSLALAEQLLAQSSLSATQHIGHAYRRTLGREPSPAEVNRTLAFLESFEGAYRTSQDAAPGGRSTAVLARLAGEQADLPVDQDDERVTLAPVEDPVNASSPRAAAWMSFVQALYASAEFRFLR